MKNALWFWLWVLPTAAFGATQWTCTNENYSMKISLDRAALNMMKIERDGGLAEGPALHWREAGNDYEGYSLNGGQSIFWVKPGNDADAHFEPCVTCVIFQCALTAAH